MLTCIHLTSNALEPARQVVSSTRLKTVCINLHALFILAAMHHDIYHTEPRTEQIALGIYIWCSKLRALASCSIVSRILTDTLLMKGRNRGRNYSR